MLFSSDNGPHKEGGRGYDPDFFDANGPVTGNKRSLTDGGIRVPMIAWWPGKIAAGRTSDHIGYFGDFMATAAELAGTTTPAGLDSISFVPTLVGPTAERPQAEHRYLYWEFYEGGKPRQAVRFGKWKAIATVGGPIALVRRDDRHRRDERRVERSRRRRRRDSFDPRRGTCRQRALVVQQVEAITKRSRRRFLVPRRRAEPVVHFFLERRHDRRGSALRP